MHQEGVAIRAGNFSKWLRDTEGALRAGRKIDVPCGACRGCCRSSMFIHVAPEEIRTLQRIPPALLFPAPGFPKGHVLMGYDDEGRCPMLVDANCSIYMDRPQTCREYDCRVFAATGVAVDPQFQAEIANRVKSWAFDYESEVSREEHTIVKEAAAFMQGNRDLFPAGSLPTYPVQLAALAIRVYKIFLDLAAVKRTTPAAASSIPDTAIAHAIVSALSAPDVAVR